MWLTSPQVAKLCDASSSWMQRFLKHALRVRPDRCANKNRWGGRHVCGAMVCAALEVQLSVSPEWALIVGRAIADMPSDEAFEAMIDGGRCWVVTAGKNASPQLHTDAELKELDATVGPQMAALGVTIKAFDLRPVWADIRKAAGLDVKEEASEFATE